MIPVRLPASITRRNQMLAVAFVVPQFMQSILLPVWLLPFDPTSGWLLLFPILLANSWWAFIHEAIHGSLFASPAANRLVGRLHGILFGASFELLRWGHLLHHALSRSRRDRTEVRPADGGSVVTFAVGYYFRLVGGLYLFEVLGGLLLLLPRPLLLALGARLARPDNLLGALADKLLEPANLARARLDAMAILALHAMAFLLYAEHAWMLLLALLGRGFLVSLLDNVFHYDTPLDDRRHARNLRLPDWASALLLHFNLHGTHHLRPTLSCWSLPEQHRDDADGFQGGLLTLLLCQFRGPIPESHPPGRGSP